MDEVVIVTKDGNRFGLPEGAWRNGPSEFGSHGWVRIPWGEGGGETWVRRDQVVYIEVTHKEEK